MEVPASPWLTVLLTRRHTAGAGRRSVTSVTQQSGPEEPWWRHLLSDLCCSVMNHKSPCFCGHIMSMFESRLGRYERLCSGRRRYAHLLTLYVLVQLLVQSTLDQSILLQMVMNSLFKRIHQYGESRLIVRESFINIIEFCESYGACYQNNIFTV